MNHFIAVYACIYLRSVLSHESKIKIKICNTEIALKTPLSAFWVLCFNRLSRLAGTKMTHDEHSKHVKKKVAKGLNMVFWDLKPSQVSHAKKKVYNSKWYPLYYTCNCRNCILMVLLFPAKNWSIPRTPDPKLASPVAWDDVQQGNPSHRSPASWAYQHTEILLQV